jgi:class 3 adenylate cyclase/predicted ATPase
MHPSGSVLDDGGTLVDVAGWLTELGLERYEQAFRDNEVDADLLPNLTADDLKDLGVSLVGHRRRLLDAIAELRSVDQPPPTDADLAAPRRSGEPGGDTQTPTPPALGERRQVSVLFADLVGFTRLSGELDAEEVHQLLGRFFARVDGLVEAFGGTIDKHIGDCVMAVFGAPVAHGNDAERAARAALAIQDAMAGLSGEVGRRLAVHVGLASGQVVASGTGSASHREYTVTGESVNLASRLTDRAAAGEILISAGVRHLLPAGFALKRRGALEVKGIQAPVETWRLVGAEERSEPSRRPFVGRLAELRQLLGALEACVESDGGQPVHVRGEAGIGKTRLVEALRERAAALGFACHTALVLDFGTATGQDAIRALVRSLLGLRLGAARAEAGQAAARAIDDGIVVAENRVFLNDLLGLPQPVELRALYDAMDNARRNQGQRATVAELVRNLSQSGPLLLVVEDVHWAERLTLEHLASLARAVAECRAVLVTTSRIEGDPLDQDWRQTLGASPLLTIDLGPLRPQEAEALAGVYRDASAEVARRCLERAAGNPLFLEQLLSHAEESADAVPGSVQSLVQARLDRLEAADKAALQAASVLGQRFALEALRHLIESPDYACAGPLAHHLVRPEAGAAEAKGATLLFAHALIRDAVYDSLLRTRRQELHGRAASWFAERDLVLRADHLDRAADLAAPAAYLEAARQQAADYRMEGALTLAERGLALAATPSTVHALQCIHGDLLRENGEVERSITAFESALEVAEDDPQRCQALIGRAAGMRIVDRIDDALGTLDRAQVMATEHRLDRELSQIHYCRGNLYFPRFDGCLEQHELARRHARDAGSVEDEARALSGLGDAYYLRGRMITAHGHFDRCIELCREHGLARIEVANLQMSGATLLYQNRLIEAVTQARKAAEAAAKVGNQRAQIVARIVCSYVAWEMGRWDEAREQSERGLHLACQLGARRFESMCLFSLAYIEALTGNRARATKPAEDAVAISRETGARIVGPWALGVLALVAEDHATRRRARAEAEDLLRQDCVSHNYHWFYRLAMDACLEDGEWNLVERYAAALEAYTRPEPLPWSDFYIARGRALAAHSRGRRDDELRIELRRLRDDAIRVRLRVALPALDQALAAD